MLATIPFFMPTDGAMPYPMMSTSPERPTSPMRVVTFVVPASMPTSTVSLSKLPPMVAR